MIRCLIDNETDPVYMRATSADWKKAKRIGAQRLKKQRTYCGDRNWGGNDALEDFQLGALGEILTARFYEGLIDEGLYIGGDGGVDVILKDGKTVQVVTRRSVNFEFCAKDRYPGSMTADFGCLVHQMKRDKNLFRIYGTISRSRFRRLAAGKETKDFGYGPRAYVRKDEMDPPSFLLERKCRR